MNLSRLEDLFVEKLTEKYRLTERDLKKAFVKYDIDKSGYLSTEELTNAIHLYLNGVDRSQVAELVRRYDVDQDGTISIEEFCEFLVSRNSLSKDKWLNVSENTKSSYLVSDRSSVTKTGDNSEVIGNDKQSIEYRAKMFLQNLKALLIKQTLDMRNQRQLSKVERLSNTNQLLESVSRNVIKKAFHSYLNTIAGKSGAELESFIRYIVLVLKIDNCVHACMQCILTCFYTPSMSYLISTTMICILFYTYYTVILGICDCVLYFEQSTRKISISWNANTTK